LLLQDVDSDVARFGDAGDRAWALRKSEETSSASESSFLRHHGRHNSSFETLS